jgi:uncharacterized membrane protein
MKRARIFALIAALVVALILAFALQDVIRKTVVIPLAYLWWVLGLYYRAFPQAILWAGLVALVLLMLFGSLSTEDTRERPVERAAKPAHGPVESLAISLEKAHNGIYVKWMIAHRLGKLARDLLIQRGDRDSTKVIGPLTGRDWRPSQSVDAYLDAGLNGSFADYPRPRWPFKRIQSTPLDLNVSDVVEFLEVQMENHDRH